MMSTHSEPDTPEADTATRVDPLGTALGWFGLTLGATELASPAALARVVGVDDGPATRILMRILGAREVASGIGVLGSERPGRWLWRRVAGDAVDLSVLAAAAACHRFEVSRLARLGLAAAAVAGVAVLDAVAARRHSGQPPLPGHLVRARSTTTVRRAPEDLYRTWHDFSALPTFMHHLDSVRTTDGRSHWKARGPAGTTVEWDAEIVEDRPAELIAWRSVRGADVRNAGRVRFVKAPGDRGTEVHVELEYEAPGGAAGVAVAKALGEEPGQQIADDLRRFKQLMETGEVVRSAGGSAGTASAVDPLRQPAARPLG